MYYEDVRCQKPNKQWCQPQSASNPRYPMLPSHVLSNNSFECPSCCGTQYYTNCA